MTPQQLMALALDPSLVLKARGMLVDPWQRNFLLAKNPYVLLNCSRQAGKSTVTSALALHTALFRPKSTIIILSPGQRQSSELFKKVLEAYSAIGRPLKAEYETQMKTELTNGSRVLCPPGREETIRNFSPDLLLADEASRVPDDLYRAVRPMPAVSKGRFVALSTPYAQRGWFWSEWEKGGDSWRRFKATWKDCPRITPEFITEEERAMGKGWVDQVESTEQKTERVKDARAVHGSIVTNPNLNVPNLCTSLRELPSANGLARLARWIHPKAAAVSSTPRMVFRPERPILSAQPAGLGTAHRTAFSALKGPFVDQSHTYRSSHSIS